MSTISDSNLCASDSQDLGHLDSFSLPSEPPNIENWFPSYAYESPKLNTLDCFQDFDGSGETFVEDRKDANSGGSRSASKVDDALLDASKKLSDGVMCDESGELKCSKCSSPVTESSESVAFSSEPPDIKKWFSSYVYESPPLGTMHDIAMSDHKEREDDKLCNVQMNCRQDKNNVSVAGSEGVELCSQSRNLDVVVKRTNLAKDSKLDYRSFSSKITESSESSLTFSYEPPDIKKWFSSYTYESPPFDPTHDFSMSDHREREDGKFCNVQMNCRQDKNDSFACSGERVKLYGQSRNANVVVKCTNLIKDSNLDNRSSSKDVHNAGLKPMPSVPSQLTSDEVLDPTSSELRTQNNSDGCGEVLVKTNTCDKDDDKYTDLHSNLNIGSLDVESADKSTIRMEPVNEQVEKEHVHGIVSPGKGDAREWHSDENESPENGFVSVRKNTGNLRRCTQEEVRSCRSGVEPKRSQEKDGKVVRKALSEISNCCSGNVEESKGKWRCPQKNKPERGPPLKQLRLNQWLFRL